MGAAKMIAAGILAIAVLAMVAVCISCAAVVGRISKEEERQANRQMEEDRFCCYDDRDSSGLIEED